ncbi:hypothetical protein, partial [Listeria monocytogenes]|uniref:hypothetical protein n=1 Tax=Listeria monocytogenes TaxID=1639 RepID=UPI000D810109
NLRVDVDSITIFEDFVDTLEPVEGPNLPEGSLVRFTGFNFASEPNEPAPLPTLFLEIYENGIMIDRQSADLTGYVNTVALI